MTIRVDDSRETSLALDTNDLSTPIHAQSLADVHRFNMFFRGITEDMADDFDALLRNKPDWIDPEKLKRGQKFAMDNYFGVSFAEILSLYMIFAYSPRDLDTLIYTRQSDTPYRAYRRYFQTSVIVKSWLETDILTSGTDGNDNLRKVFRMHRRVKEDLSRKSDDEVTAKCKISGKAWCPSLADLRKDFNTCVSSRKVETSLRSNTSFNQCNLAMTQFGFFGLAVAYPERFGIHNFSAEDMNNFVHLWRTIGYFMGVRDEYNFGRGTLDEVVERSKWIIRTSMLPALQGVTDKWEHMSRCLIEGIRMYMKGCIPFDVSLCYLCDILGLDMANFKKSLGFKKRVRVWWIRLIMKYVLKYSDRLKCRMNRKVINNLNRTAREINDENIQRDLKNKVFTFENSN